MKQKWYIHRSREHAIEQSTWIASGRARGSIDDREGTSENRRQRQILVDTTGLNFSIHWGDPSGHRRRRRFDGGFTIGDERTWHCITRASTNTRESDGAGGWDYDAQHRWLNAWNIANCRSWTLPCWTETVLENGKSNNSVWTLSFDALTALSRTLDIGYITITWGWFRMPSLILWVAFQQYGPSIPGPNLSAHVSSKPVTSPWQMVLGLRGNETMSLHASFVTTHQPLFLNSNQHPSAAT